MLKGLKWAGEFRPFEKTARGNWYWQSISLSPCGPHGWSAVNKDTGMSAIGSSMQDALNKLDIYNV